MHTTKKLNWTKNYSKLKKEPGIIRAKIPNKTCRSFSRGAKMNPASKNDDEKNIVEKPTQK